MARKPLNSRQVEVLQWIAHGCPDRVWPDFTYKHTAVALQGRRLVKVSKRGGWHAEITDDGRFYLLHSAYPGESEAAKRPAVRRKPRPAKPIPQPAPAKQEPDPEAVGEQNPIAAPPQTEDANASVESRPTIAVPVALRNPHPAIAELRDDKSRLDLTASARGRALRVLQALATEAEVKGWTVRAPRVKRRNEHGYSHFESANHLIVETGEQSIGIRVVQLTDRGPHVPTEEELLRQKSWGSTPPKYDHTPNDYLRIELDGGWESKQSNFSEGPRGPIDRKLRRVIDEVAYRSERAKDRRLEQEARETQRERQYAIAVDRARLLLQQEHRAKVLLEQVSRSERVTQIRTYVETMEATAEGLDEQARVAAQDWIDWASRYADTIDPLKPGLCMPEDPEPTAEALRPYMGGWAQYGPRG